MQKTLNLIPILIVLSFSSCVYQKAELAPEIAAQLEQTNKGKIALQNFFKEATYSHLKISPDGRYLAVLFPQNGRNSLAVFASDLSKLIYTGQFDEDRHVLALTWVNDTRLVLHAGKRFGYLDGRDSDVRTYFVDYNGKNFKDFFTKQWASYDLIRVLPNDPNHVVMAKYHWRDGGKPIAVKVDVNTGREQALAFPPIKRGTFLADVLGEVNVAIESSKESYLKTEIYFRLGRDSKWSKLSYPAKGKGIVSPIQLDVQAKALYVLSNIETGFDGIYKLDLTSGQSTPISQDPKVDVTSLIMDEDRVVGARYDPGYTEIEIINKESELMQIYAEVSAAFPKLLLDDLQLTRDRSMGIFKVSSDRNPGEFYKIDVKTRKVYKLGSARDWINPEAMAETLVIELKARDGLPLNGYLTLPKQGPMKALPMVVLLHGGPHGVRDYWEFDPEVQFLANRGFAVLKVNFRGSGGYGAGFQEAGYRQWGRAMQDDVTDATQWAIAQGYADAKRICIYGASYGGYAALMGAVREPSLYRCAVDYAGVSDLTIQTSQSDTSDRKAGVDYLQRVLGSDQNELKANSALYHIDRIKIPIFIAHGKDDVRVPFAHAERLKEAFDRSKQPYEWMAKDFEGHGFSQEANRFEFYLRLAKFLEKHTAAVP